MPSEDQPKPEPQPQQAVAVPESLELLRYKEELMAKMGLPSNYAMSVLRTVCSDLAESGMVPAFWKNNPNAMFMAALRGREMGLAPLESIIETFWLAPGGKLGMYANKMLALMQRKGVVTEVLEETETKCSIRFIPPPPHKEYISTFTIEEAQKAGLVKPDSNWTKWRRKMLFSKAAGTGCRVMAGTVEGFGNLYTKEEIEDMPEERASMPARASEFKVGRKKDVIVEAQIVPEKGENE